MRSIQFIILAVVLAVSAVYGAWWYFDRQGEQTSVSQREESDTDDAEPLSLEDRFVAAFYEADLKNLETLELPPKIIGDVEADARMRDLAERRGYRLQRVASGNLSKLEDVEVQREVARAWKMLEEAALEDDIRLGVLAGYVSIEDQREVFLDRLRVRARNTIGREFTSAQIAGGTADAIINDILREIALPGYLKHHSGYAIDITDIDANLPSEEFVLTDGYKWISRNNYANIREFGFLPSYPDGAAAQGVETRAVELVWVGVDQALEP